MSKLLKSIMATIAILSASGLAAEVQPATSSADVQIDSLMASHRMIYFGEGDTPAADSIRGLIYNFYYDQFRNFQDPAAPYFLFMSKDANLAMGIGGMVRMRGYFDWGGAVPASGFAPILIPMTPGNGLNDKKLGTTPAGTALFFRVIGRNKKLGVYQLYIECNFNGYQTRDFHLKKAYAIINDWTIGYANSTFSDPSALPPVIDAQGPNAKMSQTAVLVRWMKTWKQRWTVAASVETPDFAPATSETVAARSQYVPNFAAFAQIEWERSQHVRLAAIVRQLPYRDLQAGRNYNLTGWGLQASAVIHPVAPLTVYATVNGGKGYAGLGGDLLIGNYDLVPDPDQPGRAYAPHSYGYFLGLQYNIRPDLFVSATFGQARYLPSKDVSRDEYKYGIFSCANIMWNLTPRIQAGAEFDLGMRRNFSGEHRWARRIGLLAGFSF